MQALRIQLELVENHTIVGNNTELPAVRGLNSNERHFS